MRRVLLVGIAGLALLVGAFLLWPERPLAVQVTVRNETGTRLAGLALSDEGLQTPLPAIANGESITVEPRIGGGEGTLSLLDGEAREYLVLGYFEGNPGGSATVLLTASTPDGLRGSVDDRTLYHAMGRHDLGRSK